jgi:hypothetical protein
VGAGVRLPGQTGQTTDFFLLFFFFFGETGKKHGNGHEKVFDFFWGETVGLGQAAWTNGTTEPRIWEKQLRSLHSGDLRDSPWRWGSMLLSASGQQNSIYSAASCLISLVTL